MSAQSKISQAHTIAMTSGENEMIPPPPHVAPNVHEFICPFCCFSLPTSDAQDRDAWAAHVKKDFDSYTCVFFPCERGEVIFGTSSEWILHEQTHCMRWYCRAKMHVPKAFVSQEEFTSHMNIQHPGKFKETQLPFLANNSRRPLKRIFDSCPFCGEEYVEGKSLEDHVAHHLQHIALLSLPLPDDIDYPENVGTAFSIELRDEDKVAVSRTTVESENHLMPVATFSYDDENPIDRATSSR